MKFDHDSPVEAQARRLIEVFGARAYGVARRMQRRNFRKPERARYWAAVARAVRHARADEQRARGAATTGSPGSV
ncbi:hypothetical protein [Rhodoplanes sp. SY1]|uniref:hypothetical protein n=1 Tax=Rhodoplanes sp. SY1 TaxID=3166646 RepID=UPI0038B490B4